MGRDQPLGRTDPADRAQARERLRLVGTGYPESQSGAQAAVPGVSQPMSGFFTNLLDRHLGTCNVVEPRGRSRFETEVAGSAILLPIDHSGTEETGDENLERQDNVVRILENHSVRPHVNSIEPQRIDTEVKLPVDHTEPVGARGDNLECRDDLIRPTANDSISADVNAPEMKPHPDIPVLRQQDWQPVILKPVEQTNPKEENAPRQVIHRHSTVVTENQRTLPWDLPKPISRANPTEEANVHTSELGYRFEGELDNRVRTTLARLQDRQNVRPAEPAETNNLDRSVVTKPGNADDAEKDRAAQPLLVAPLFDESEKVGSSDTDQERQYAFASDNRDISRDGSLEPPTWFSDMQAEFNRRWNELNSKSEPEPVINVTIGRVEVRAVQADAPKKAKHQKKSSGVMSLDEYLNQRERRG